MFVYVPLKCQVNSDLKLKKVFLIRLFIYKFIFNSLLKIQYVFLSGMAIDCRIANRITTNRSNQFPDYSYQITQIWDIILF